MRVAGTRNELGQENTSMMPKPRELDVELEGQDDDEQPPITTGNGSAESDLE